MVVVVVVGCSSSSSSSSSSSVSGRTTARVVGVAEEGSFGILDAWT